MGKVYNYLAILVFIDILFIITGQSCNAEACSTSSILFNAILNLKDFNFTSFVTELFGNVADLTGSTTGIVSLLAGVGITIGVAFSRSDNLLYVTVATSLGLLVSDLVFIYGILASLNVIWATVIMGPLMIMYIFTVVEWLRGKD